MFETTFIIIKPDAVERNLVGKIIQRLEDIGLQIMDIKVAHKNETWAEQHYAHIKASHLYLIYPKLVAFMTKSFAPLIGIVLRGERAIYRVRQMIGATNALDAKPGTIRGDYGRKDGPFNLIHSSDAWETVDKEIELFFNITTDIG